MTARTDALEAEVAELHDEVDRLWGAIRQIHTGMAGAAAVLDIQRYPTLPEDDAED
jgi:hypothetical protein